MKALTPSPGYSGEGGGDVHRLGRHSCLLALEFWPSCHPAGRNNASLMASAGGNARNSPMRGRQECPPHRMPLTLTPLPSYREGIETTMLYIVFTFDRSSVTPASLRSLKRISSPP